MDLATIAYINERIHAVVAQSGGFTDEDLMDACEQALSHLEVLHDFTFGEGGILDPIQVRKALPTLRPRSVTSISSMKLEDLLRPDWKEQLLIALEENFTDMLVESAVDRLNAKDGIKEDCFSPHCAERVENRLKPFMNAIINGAETVIQSEKSLNKKRKK